MIDMSALYENVSQPAFALQFLYVQFQTVRVSRLIGRLLVFWVWNVI